MKKLKVPSLQHLAKIWRDRPELVQRELIRMATNPPHFSYEPLQRAIRDMMVWGVPYEQVYEFVKRAERRPIYQKVLLEILPLVRAHLEGVTHEGFQDVAPRFYSVAREIRIPFNLPLIYRQNGQFHVPWCSFWRSNPLAGKQLSFFATMVDEMLLDDPDLNEARFHILDFSIPKDQAGRQLQLTEGIHAPRIKRQERDKMLEIFAEGYWLAVRQLEAQPPANKSEQRTKPDAGQHDLFRGS